MKKDFVSLAEARPDLAKEWNDEKNGDLKPEDVSCGSNKKVWWKLPYDVPDDYPVEHLRGKHFEFEWEAAISNRIKGRKCPFLSGRAIWKGFNDLQTVNPKLAAQWHPTKNGDLKPSEFTANANQKVWWLYPYDDTNTGKHFNFEWQASINDRNNEKGCPFLSGRAVLNGFNDLQTINPELAKQWHPTKNRDLKPTQVTANIDKKVWWLLSYNVPNDYPIKHLRGKHFDFEWEAKINNRVNKRGCPYLTGRAVWPGFNDLATIRPDLATQWHPIKNGELKPTQVTANSGLKVWWLLSYDVPLDYPIEHLRGKHFEFEWEATIDSRNRIDSKGGCPYLSGRAVWEGFNDLQTVNPTLAKEWHPTKNGCLKPTRITANSDKKVWWLKTINDNISGEVHIIEWQASISNRMSKKSGVPHRYKNIPTKGFNDFLTLYPEKAKQWDYKKNQGLKPSDVSANSTKVVWWKYDYFDESMKKIWSFTWKMSIVNYVKLTSVCPYVSGERLWPGFNDLKTKFPEIAKEWHPTKNGDFTPEICFAYSGKKVWWIYPYDVPMDYPIKSLRGKHFDFEWQDIVQNRTKNNFKCPVLTGKMAWPGFNDLNTTHHEIAKQWHPTKNAPLTPDKVTAGNNKKIIWVIQDTEPIEGKKIDLEWESQINSRAYHDLGCPYLSGRAVKKGYNDLASLRPDLAKEWNYDKNENLTPDMVTCCSKKKVWWIQYDVSPVTNEIIKLEWESTISNRTNGNGNPYKSGKAVLKGYNDLRTLRPDLAKEWNYKKNGDLTPDMVTCGCDKKVWWLLPYDDPNTGKHFDFEWQARIYSRNKGVGCPYLTAYKGEEYIKQYLQRNNIAFNIQQKFSDLFGTGDGQLLYDFSIPDKKYGYILIEYNGIQHYEAVEHFGGEEQFKKQKEHDKRKRDYAKKHGYKLITIKYTYDTYESVEEYLDKELKKLGVINDSVNLCSPSPDVDGVSDNSPLPARYQTTGERSPYDGSPYTSSNHQTDGQPKIGHGFPSIDDTKKKENVNDAA